MDASTWTADLLAARTGDMASLDRVLRQSRQDLRRYGRAASFSGANGLSD